MSKKIAILIAISSLFWLQLTKIDIPQGFSDEKNVYTINYILIRSITWAGQAAAMLNYGHEASNTHNLFSGTVSQLKSLTGGTDQIEKANTKIKGISVRVYKPSDAKNLPVVIFYHGGGFWLGNTDMYDDALTELAISSNVVIISVDYKLAPNYPFPAPTDDCYKVTKYVLASGDEYGDTNRVVLAGDSAGGNIVAVMTQRLLAEKSKLPKLQVLIYPWTQMFNLRLPSASSSNYLHAAFFFEYPKYIAWYLGHSSVSDELYAMIANNNHTLLVADKKLLAKYKEYTNVALIPQKYKAGKKYYETHEIISDTIFPKTVDARFSKDKKLVSLFEQAFRPEVSPGLADPAKLRGLPKAHFVMCETDPIKDEGLIYSERLRQVGVDVNVAFYEECFHGVFQLNDQAMGFKISRTIISDLAMYISQNV